MLARRGGAVLEFSLNQGRVFRDGALSANAFRHSKWDVVVGEEINLVQHPPPYRWCSSLWYCRLPGNTEFRWHEASYFATFRHETFAPYSLTGSINDADLAAAPITGGCQLAFGPLPIDDENEEDFIERWSALLALASEGKLGHPRGLPLPAQFWRHPFVA